MLGLSILLVGAAAESLSTLLEPSTSQTQSQKDKDDDGKEDRRQEAVRRKFALEHAERTPSAFIRRKDRGGEEDEEEEDEDGTWKRVLGFLDLEDLLRCMRVSRGFERTAKRRGLDGEFLLGCAVRGFGEKRGRIWEVVLNSERPRDVYEEVFGQLLKCVEKESENAMEILRDVKRTFPEEKEFEGVQDQVDLSHGQKMLFDLLAVYAVHDSEVGYAQGMNFLVGFILMHTEMNPGKAFWFLECIMREYDLRWQFLPGLPHLNLFLWQFQRCFDLYLPKLAEHFHKVDIDCSIFALEWFMTLFTYALPRNMVERIWDLFLVSGRKVVFQVGLALLCLAEDSLEKLDMENSILFLKSTIGRNISHPDILIHQAVNFPITDSFLEDLEVEYVRDVMKKS